MASESPTPILESATKTLDREREELLAERRAFEGFARRVANLEAEPVTHAQLASSAGAVQTIGSNACGCSAVRDAYTETVLELPHYDRYDETWIESIAAEFTADLAAALEQQPQLHPPLKQSLQNATQQAVTNRTELLELVDAERDAVANATDELAAIVEDLESLRDQPIDRLEFNALRLTRARLEKLRKRCDDLATDRQAQLRRRQRDLPAAETGTLEGYLYGACERSFPVLAAIATVGERIEAALDDVDRSIATC